MSKTKEQQYAENWWSKLNQRTKTLYRWKYNYTPISKDPLEAERRSSMIRHIYSSESHRPAPEFVLTETWRAKIIENALRIVINYREKLKEPESALDREVKLAYEAIKDSFEGIATLKEANIEPLPMPVRIKPLYKTILEWWNGELPEDKEIYCNRWLESEAGKKCYGHLKVVWHRLRDSDIKEIWWFEEGADLFQKWVSSLDEEGDRRMRETMASQTLADEFVFSVYKAQQFALGGSLQDFNKYCSNIDNYG